MTGRRDRPAPTDEHQGPQLFESRDQDEINAFISENYIGSRARLGTVSDGASFRASTTGTPHLQGGMIRSRIDYGGSSDPFGTPLFYVCVNGTVRVDGVDGVEQRLLPGDASFFALGTPLDFDFSDIGFELLTLPAGHIEQIAEELTDVPADQVRFLHNEPVSVTARRRWLATFAYLRRTLDAAATAPLSPLLTAQLARLLAVSALDTFANTTTGRHHQEGPGHVAPASLRRAVDYIESHADQPVTLADIAAAAGTSGRALQHAFRRHHDSTPMGYLRRTRLHRAHVELHAADPTRGDTVSAIAARWGFANPDRFATRYRKVYGQPPSRTLRS